MARRIIDISVPLMAGIASDPPHYVPKIEYLDHHATAPDLAAFFGVPVSALPDAGLIWEGHRAGRDIGYCHIEKLHNLESLPDDGFEVACFPVKVHRGSAGWTRAVAILP